MRSEKFRKKYEEDINRSILTEFSRTVDSGPFKGMKYISTANGSALWPKIIGSYERELHPVIEELIKMQYDCIVDIGCAEGYYAVGLAFRLKKRRLDTRIIAYDIDLAAHENFKKLAELNEVSNQLELKTVCNFDELNSFAGCKTFIICDIEGGEVELLNPAYASAILNFDMLIEVHDGGSKSSRIKDILKSRFENTHAISIIPVTPRTSKDYSRVRWIKNEDHKKMVVNEGRIYGLEWMYLQKL